MCVGVGGLGFPRVTRGRQEVGRGQLTTLVGATLQVDMDWSGLIVALCELMIT